jgi:hypothetical protein
VSTLAAAWDAFLAAIADAQALDASGADAAAIQDLLQHARELLDIIADEAALSGISLPEWTQKGLEQMRERLITAESALVSKH